MNRHQGDSVLAVHARLALADFADAQVAEVVRELAEGDFAGGLRLVQQLFHVAAPPRAVGRQYVNPFSEVVFASFVTAGDFDNYHDPTVCVPSNGFNLSGKKTFSLEGPGKANVRAMVFKRLDPKFGPARLLAGTSLLALGRADEAVVELERAVQLLPGEKAAHLKLSDACQQAGDAPCLARQSRVLASLAPSDPESLYRLGKAYLSLSEWSYRRILAINPRSARLSEALGREYLRQGQPDMALRAYQEAAERDPKLPGIHLALAGIHADAMRWDDAARELELELAVAPGSAAALALKARVDAARSAR